MKFSKQARLATILGFVCSFAYMNVYFVRSVLSIVTPDMLDSGYSTEYIGLVSTVFMITYGVGQLLNGMIGDRIKAKHMICLGLFAAALSNITFVIVEKDVVQYISYGICGFAMSMIYAPVTKIIAENVSLKYATRAILGVTFAAFIASPLAGIAAIILNWRPMFVLGSLLLMLSCVMCFVVIKHLERNYGISYIIGSNKTKGNSEGCVRTLLKKEIARYTCVSAITGVIRTSVIFWIPTFFVQYLGYESSTSAVLYSFVTIVISVAPYANVWCHSKIFRRDMHKAVLIYFLLGAVCFFLMCIVKVATINVFLVTAALLFGNMASSVLWNIYCPSLQDTGYISTATGYLDFMSYAGGAVANILFANAVDKIGWLSLLIVWGVIMLVGTTTGFSVKHLDKSSICRRD